MAFITLNVQPDMGSMKVLSAFCSFPFVFHLQINKSQGGSMTASIVHSLLSLIGPQHPAVKLPGVSFHKFIVSSSFQQ